MDSQRHHDIDEVMKLRRSYPHKGCAAIALIVTAAQ